MGQWGQNRLVVPILEMGPGSKTLPCFSRFELQGLVCGPHSHFPSTMGIPVLQTKKADITESDDSGPNLHVGGHAVLSNFQSRLLSAKSNRWKQDMHLRALTTLAQA
jgi:hypothetical protein